MQFDYSALLTSLPDITIDKVGPEQLATTDGRAFAIGQLINKHSGQIVAAPPLRSSGAVASTEPRRARPILSLAGQGPRGTVARKIVGSFPTGRSRSTASHAHA